MIKALQISTGYEKKGGRSGGNCSLPPVPNGSISFSIHLACALRYFAGGSPLDFAPLYGISYSEAISSVWITIAAINMCPDFDISYPDSLKEQRKIAAEFQKASSPVISNCAGAIDGILIWILKPSSKQAKESGLGQKKFLCGRKSKFGLNC